MGPSNPKPNANFPKIIRAGAEAGGTTKCYHLPNQGVTIKHSMWTHWHDSKNIDDAVCVEVAWLADAQDTRRVELRSVPLQPAGERRQLQRGERPAETAPIENVERLTGRRM